MINKICNRCGKIIPVGQRCTCVTPYRRDYNAFRRDKRIAAFRRSAEWIRMRQQILARDEGIDQYLRYTTGELRAGFSVHHIIPISENWELRLEPSNLITLSDDTHGLIEYRYRTKQRERLQSELHAIAESQQQKPPGGGYNVENF